MAKDVYLVLRGELNWAKLVGPAKPHTGEKKYDKGPSWSVELTPDDASLEKLAEEGLVTGGRNGTGKLKTPKGNDFRTKPYLRLTVLENRSDGTKNDPPKVERIDGTAWGDTLIGNGTIADVKVKVKDYGDTVEKGVYLQNVRILKLVEYQGRGFEPLDEDDEYFAQAMEQADPDEDAVEPDLDTKGDSPNPDDLDDDIPF